MARSIHRRSSLACRLACSSSSSRTEHLAVERHMMRTLLLEPAIHVPRAHVGNCTTRIVVRCVKRPARRAGLHVVVGLETSRIESGSGPGTCSAGAVQAWHWRPPETFCNRPSGQFSHRLLHAASPPCLVHRPAPPATAGGRGCADPSIPSSSLSARSASAASRSPSGTALLRCLSLAGTFSL